MTTIMERTANRTTEEEDTDEYDSLEGPEDEGPGEDWESEELPGDGEPGMTLAEFINRNHKSITDRIIEAYRPTYDPALDQDELPEMRRQPIGLQEQTIRGAVKSLRENRGTNVVGEMGSGKTLIAITAARMAGFKRVMVMCPPHMVRKWRREVQETLTPNEGEAVIVESVSDLRDIQRNHGRGGERDERTLFIIMSREKAKLSYGWENCPAWSLPMTGGKLMRDDQNRPLVRRHVPEALYDESGRMDLEAARKKLQRLPRCVRCAKTLVDKEGIPILEAEVFASRIKMTCQNLLEGSLEVCGAPLWQSAKGDLKNNRIGLAEYAKKRMKGYFDLLVADEVHEYKGKHTAQGAAAATGADVCGKSLVLTGTLMGGFSSTLFYLLYRFRPEFRQSFPHNGEGMWVNNYGFLEQTIHRKITPERLTAHGSASRRKITTKTTKKEVPGLMPGALSHLIENSIFLRLHDVSKDLPPYEEYVLTVPMEDRPNLEGLTQKSAYQKLENVLHLEVKKALMKGSQRLLGAYIQSLLAYPDGVTRGETVTDPRDDRLIIEIPPLDEDRLYPKEQQLLDLVNSERRKGRKVLVYVTHTNTRDITGRIRNILERNGHRAAVLKSDSVKSSEREAWINREVERGAGVLICNPRLVQTGLDLISFPTVIWFETDYSVYTMRQASRRSWRIGQKLPVHVYYMTYQECFQAKALRLIAAKVQSSLAVEGELPEEGLSAYGDTKDNLIVTLARQVAGTLRPSQNDLEELEEEFRRARRFQEQSEIRLVRGDGWEIPGPEPDGPAPDQTPEETSELAAAGRSPAPTRLPEQPILGKNGQTMMFAMDEFLKTKG